MGRPASPNPLFSLIRPLVASLDGSGSHLLLILDRKSSVDRIPFTAMPDVFFPAQTLNSNYASLFPPGRIPALSLTRNELLAPLAARSIMRILPTGISVTPLSRLRPPRSPLPHSIERE